MFIQCALLILLWLPIIGYGANTFIKPIPYIPNAFLYAESLAEKPTEDHWHSAHNTVTIATLTRINRELYTKINLPREEVIKRLGGVEIIKASILFNKWGDWCCFGSYGSKVYLMFGQGTGFLTNFFERYESFKKSGFIESIEFDVTHENKRATHSVFHIPTHDTSFFVHAPRLLKISLEDKYYKPISVFGVSRFRNCMRNVLIKIANVSTLFKSDWIPQPCTTYNNGAITIVCPRIELPIPCNISIHCGINGESGRMFNLSNIYRFAGFWRDSSSVQCQCSTNSIADCCSGEYKEICKIVDVEGLSYPTSSVIYKKFVGWHILHKINTPFVPSTENCTMTIFSNPYGDLVFKCFYSDSGFSNFSRKKITNTNYDSGESTSIELLQKQAQRYAEQWKVINNCMYKFANITNSNFRKISLLKFEYTNIDTLPVRLDYSHGSKSYTSNNEESIVCDSFLIDAVCEIVDYCQLDVNPVEGKHIWRADVFVLQKPESTNKMLLYRPTYAYSKTCDEFTFKDGTMSEGLNRVQTLRDLKMFFLLLPSLSSSGSIEVSADHADQVMIYLKKNSCFHNVEQLKAALNQECEHEGPTVTDMTDTDPLIPPVVAVNNLLSHNNNHNSNSNSKSDVNAQPFWYRYGMSVINGLFPHNKPEKKLDFGYIFLPLTCIAYYFGRHNFILDKCISFYCAADFGDLYAHKSLRAVALYKAALLVFINSMGSMVGGTYTGFLARFMCTVIGMLVGTFERLINRGEDKHSDSF